MEDARSESLERRAAQIHQACVLGVSRLRYRHVVAFYRQSELQSPFCLAVLWGEHRNI